MLITILSLIVAVKFVSSSSGDCKIAKNVLNQLKANIAEMIDDNPKNETDCEQLLVKIVNFSSRLRDALKTKATADHRTHNETEMKLQIEEMEMFGALGSDGTERKKNYLSAIRQIQNISQSIEKAIQEQSALIVRLNFYSSQINFAEYDEATCSLNNETTSFQFFTKFISH